MTGPQSLTCTGTGITDLASLAGLTQLQSLNCSGTEITDLAPLAGLTQLQSLDCYETGITDLAPLAGLTQLQSLDCYDTSLTDLAPLAGLIQLQRLNCSHTRITDLAPLAGLTQLQTLNCSGTQITDLAPLAGLTQLQSLDCTGCPIVSWPEGFFERATLETVYASRLGSVPVEDLSQSIRDNCLGRLRAHLSDLSAGAEALRDAKLLVLGNGRVGKTQLVRGLFSQRYDPSIKSTHGIIIRRFDLDLPNDPLPARIWVWDFGGQDIYHATHALFMRSRGFYLVAWTPAAENSTEHVADGQRFRNRELPFWIGQVAEFGGTAAPLILVQTQVDTLADKTGLPKSAHSRIEDFDTVFELAHSAAKNRGHDELKEALGLCYDQMEQRLSAKCAPP